VTPPAAPTVPVADVITSFASFNEKKANNNFPEKNEVFYHIRYILRVRVRVSHHLTLTPSPSHPHPHPHPLDLMAV